MAAGLGATARLTLDHDPGGYVGVDRDEAVVAGLAALADAGQRVRGQRADAQHTGLPSRSATVVYGEAMLTMQPDPAKRRIVREAHRLLGPSGHYGIHELCLVPDDIDAALADEINAALSEAIHVGARPLTRAGWRELLASEGFTPVAERAVPMRLLETRRLIADEGAFGAFRVLLRTLHDGPARRRVLRMRAVFRRYRDQLAAVSVVAKRA
ncbi:class I SAM-dependent methyltransferase [Flindersiella endophytica]